ncbi:hypothetical protein PPERSA_03821 [Pseudocohnilembus persalinus]|uniref:Tetratricopeptide-like helical domain n=1 Tax=Pseudocohnilembus persalinus TaxID=266149 RepID=A0A0V0QU78_PSEPJ|nr:hypothetical protein PPERSA_03821 [Pseudocohnilembus persalinus]|eukprot:KRX05884.1 hypothetical protein PPERSA_03821 [Pseudocohnilembus persalinus]
MSSLTEQQIQKIKEEISTQFQNEINSLKNENILLKNQISQLQQQQNISQNILKKMAAIFNQKSIQDLLNGENFDSNSDSSDYEQNDADEKNSDSENNSSQVEQVLESPLNEKFEELYDIFYKKNNQKQAAKYIELIFQLVTEKNDPYALSWLGFSYLNGIKNMKNQKSGFQCFQEAAQLWARILGTRILLFKWIWS